MKPRPHCRPALLPLLTLLLAGWACACASADAQPNAGDVQRATELARQAAASQGPAGARVVVQVHPIDPRLKLAACHRSEPFLAAGAPAWGRTRVGLRCTQGPVAWTLYLPLTVQLWAPAFAASSAMAAGTVLTAEQLLPTQADWASGPSASAYMDAANLTGRTLARAVPAGHALRAEDLKPRIWFSAGATVLISSSSPGLHIGTQGQALSAGVEGQPVRVRTDAGRLLTGRATAERRVEVLL